MLGIPRSRVDQVACLYEKQSMYTLQPSRVRLPVARLKRAVIRHPVGESTRSGEAGAIDSIIVPRMYRTDPVPHKLTTAGATRRPTVHRSGRRWDRDVKSGSHKRRPCFAGRSWLMAHGTDEFRMAVEVPETKAKRRWESRKQKASVSSKVRKQGSPRDSPGPTFGRSRHGIRSGLPANRSGCSLRFSPASTAFSAE